MIQIEPNLLNDLQTTLNNNGYQLKASYLNNLNKARECHRYEFKGTDNTLIIEIKK